MLRANVDPSIGREIRFSDGVHLIDAPFVTAIEEATEGDPTRYTYREAMARMGKVLERRHIQRAFERHVSSHFERFGSS